MDGVGAWMLLVHGCCWCMDGLGAWMVLVHMLHSISCVYEHEMT